MALPSSSIHDTSADSDFQCENFKVGGWASVTVPLHNSLESRGSDQGVQMQLVS